MYVLNTFYIGLFRRGDGVNVYKEESYSLALYYRCIRYQHQNIYLPFLHQNNALHILFSETTFPHLFRKHLENGATVDSKIQVCISSKYTCINSTKYLQLVCMLDTQVEDLLNKCKEFEPLLTNGSQLSNLKGDSQPEHDKDNYNVKVDDPAGLHVVCDTDLIFQSRSQLCLSASSATQPPPPSSISCTNAIAGSILFFSILSSLIHFDFNSLTGGARKGCQESSRETWLNL